jgi:hypothetical protein
MVDRDVARLENCYPSLGGSRVQIPPPPLKRPNTGCRAGFGPQIPRSRSSVQDLELPQSPRATTSSVRIIRTVTVHLTTMVTASRRRMDRRVGNAAAPASRGGLLDPDQGAWRLPANMVRLSSLGWTRQRIGSPPNVTGPETKVEKRK